MAGGPSIYLANRILDKTLKGTDFTPPGTFYLALITTATVTNLRNNVIASASEVTNANAYARQAVTAAQISAAASGGTSVNVDILFPQATGSWGTIYQGALMDSATHGAGNVWYFGPLSASVEILLNDVLQIPAYTFLFGM